MEIISKNYKISLYEELVELVEDKIYIARSSLDDRIYIKKILAPENYEIYKELKGLNIDNVPKIYEIIKQDGQVIVIEEYINGKTLEDILNEGKLLTEKEVIGHILSLIEILDKLHCPSTNIIHRDIKPSNIMINNDGILKLIDFDISRIHKESKTTDTEILGTFGYAAPEQFGFNQSDIRTDIYSLGVTMNEMLTGKLPTEETYVGGLSKIISKCLEIDPDRRYQTTGQLKRALLKERRRYQKGSRGKDYSKLPGFRGRRLTFKILASLWYGLIAMWAVGMLDIEPMSEERILSLRFSIFLLLLTLLYGNYKNVKERIPMLRSPKMLVRILGYIIYTFIFGIVIM